MISPEILLRVAVITRILAPFFPGPGGCLKSLTPSQRVLLEQKLTRGHEGVSGDVRAGGRDRGPVVTVSAS